MTGRVSDPEAYCAELMRATEGRCRRRGMVAAWRKATRARRSTAIYQIADRLEPVMRRQFLAAVERLKGRVDLDALAAAIQARDLSQAQRILNIDGWPAELRRTADVIRQVFERTGTVAATQLSDQLGTAISFDLTNPRAVQWGRREGSRLISEVTESTREAVRQIIGDAIEVGIAPRESARLIRDQVGLTRQQSDAVFRRWLDLTESGRNGDDVARLTERYAQQLTKYRAEVIARTETIAASTNGQQETWRQAVDAGYLDPETTRRVWIVTPDDRLAVVGGRTAVMTISGWTPIAQIAIGDMVLTHADRFCRVSALNKRRYNGPVVKISFGGRAAHGVTLTPDHQVYVRRDGIDQWIAACDLRQTDECYLNAVPCLDCGALIESSQWHRPERCVSCRSRETNRERFDSIEAREVVRQSNLRRWAQPGARQRQSRQFSALLAERGDEIIGNGLRARARNRFGHSYLERKMKWFLDLQGIPHEPQKLFRYKNSRGKTLRSWADFYIPGRKLIIECDGPTHRDEAVAERDALRDAVMRGLGIEVLRFTDEQIRGDFQSIASEIRARCCLVRKHPKRIEHRETNHQPCYDLRVDGDESFVAGGVVVHNCPICEPMDQQEVELEEDFEVGDGSFVLVPPAHPQCRCAVALSFTRRSAAA